MMEHRELLKTRPLRLTAAEQAMLQGERGEAVRFAMETIVRVARGFGAEELVEVVSVHAMAQYGDIHDAGLDLLERLHRLGGRCCVPTTQDPASIAFTSWQRMGVPAAYADKQLRLARLVEALGERSVWTCTPYLAGNTPGFGQNVAWAESSAVSFANSVLGARTNRTPAGLAICAALTGRMPKLGLYRPECRVASVRVVVDAGELTTLDYHTLGIVLGRRLGTRIPALVGIPSGVSPDELKALGASAAASGALALYHVVGVTPEACRADPFDGRPPQEEFRVTRADLEAAARGLTTGDQGRVELVVVGCPHYSLAEVRRLAGLLRGRRVAPGKALWVYASGEVERQAQAEGLLASLQAAGAEVLAQTCAVMSPLPGGFRTLMTDSGKFASYLPSEHGVELVYGSTAACVQAVVAPEGTGA
jgi:cis-L-3-hydroxyproline dehydratase